MKFIWLMAIVLSGCGEASASEEPDLRRWYATMQEPSPESAAALYGAESAGATSTERANADRKLFRGRALEVGREIIIDEREFRQQIRTSDNSTYLLFWRRGKVDWQVDRTDPLMSWLFVDKSSPDLLWPPGAKPEGPTDVLIRLARLINTNRPSDAAIARDFGTRGHADELHLLVAAIAERPIMPLVSGRSLSDRAWTCAVRVHRSEFEVSMEQVDGAWRIKTVRLKPAPTSKGLSAADASEIQRLVDAAEKAIVAKDSDFLVKNGVDGRGSQAMEFTPESAKARLAEWRVALPGFKARFKTEDLIGIPLDGRLIIPVSDAGKDVDGYLWLARFGGSWRIVELVVPGPEQIRPEQIVPTPVDEGK